MVSCVRSPDDASAFLREDCHAAYDMISPIFDHNLDAYKALGKDASSSDLPSAKRASVVIPGPSNKAESFHNPCIEASWKGSRLNYGSCK